MLRISKVSRMLRLLGFLRMYRFSYRLKSISAHHAFDGPLGHGLEVLKLLLCIFCFNHIVSCTWYAIGSVGPDDTQVRWTNLSISPGSPVTYATAPFWYQYFSSYHWSLTQMTPGSMQVSPVNSLERLFNIVCLVLGLMFFSSFMATLSAKLVHITMESRVQMQQLRELRKFLRSTGIKAGLSLSIQKQVENRLNQEKPMTIQKLAVFEFLSHSMRLTLQFELCKHWVKKHAFFRLWMSIDKSSIKEFCGVCTHCVALSRGEIVFKAGQKATATYICMRGTLKYIQKPTYANVIEEEEQDVKEGAMVSEAALWCQWTHVGLLEAQSMCEVLCLGTDEFSKAVRGHRIIAEIAWEYAKSYHARLTSAMPPEADWPSDLLVPNTSFEDVAESMNRNMLTLIGFVAIQSLMSSTWLMPPRNISQLQEEVTAGTSILLLTGPGEVLRVVTVIVLQLKRPDGQILVQFGKWHKNEPMVTPTCIMPGSKLQQGEMPSDALQRVITSQMPAFQGHVEVNRVETVSEWKYSDTFGVKTKYVRHIFFSELQDSFDLKSLEEILHVPDKVLPISPSMNAVAERRRFLTLGDGHLMHVCEWVTPQEFDYMSTPGGMNKVKELIKHQYGDQTNLDMLEEARSNAFSTWCSRRSCLEMVSI